MTVLRRAHWIYLIGAISNWVVTVPAFLFYNRYVDAFIDTRPNYPALVWIWSGMAFLWGVAFFEISRDPLAAYPLVPTNEVGFRIQVTSANTDEQVDELLDVLGHMQERFQLESTVSATA